MNYRIKKIIFEKIIKFFKKFIEKQFFIIFFLEK